ncbi:MAG: lasso peptide biosynthesis B2 protein [Emticicia sp.]|uniref:lasso peptide biosynthesis B2 protein n=1 Tax=Emticicia sp. TaxID=1930953 RepID=UPI003BA4F38B
MKSWLKLFRVSFRKILQINKITVLKVIFWMIFFRFAIRMVSFNNLKSLSLYLTKSKKSKNYNSSQIKEIAKAVKVISESLPFNVSCLTQALTTKFLLRHDKNVLVVIGVSLKDGFEAHAWVEKYGLYIIGDTPLTKFTPIWHWEVD